MGTVRDKKDLTGCAAGEIHAVEYVCVRAADLASLASLFGAETREAYVI